MKLRPKKKAVSHSESTAKQPQPARTEAEAKVETRQMEQEVVSERELVDELEGGRGLGVGLWGKPGKGEG